MYTQEPSIPFSILDFNTIIESFPVSMIVTTPHTDHEAPKIVYANQLFQEMSGYSNKELSGISPSIFQGELSNHAELKYMKKILLSGRKFKCNTINYRKDGTPYSTTLSITPYIDALNQQVWYIGALQPHESYVKLSKLCHQAIRDSRDNIAVLNANGEFVYVNAAYTRRYGYHNHEVRGLPSKILKSGKHTQEFYEKLWNKLTRGIAVKELFINKTKDGSLVYEEQMISPIQEGGTIVGYVSIGRDLKQIIEREQELEKKAHYDQLTDVYNRHGIGKQIDIAYKQYLLSQNDYVMVMIDIDHFKQINDNYGHQIGDEVLKKMANYLKISLRKEDVLGRWGGEEFIALLKTNMENAMLICEMIRKHVNKIPFSNPEIKITASFGLARFDGTGIDMVIKNADEALYKAKKRGRNQIVSSDELGSNGFSKE